MGGAHGGEPCTKLRRTAAAALRRIAGTFSRTSAALNRSAASSKLGRYFKLDARDTSFTRELRAGTATFLTMAYIISVNASILADSGGPCNDGPGAKSGHDMGSCLQAARADLVSATALTAAIGSVAMGAVANLPFAVAPGMGSNAYFAYNMVGLRGSGPLDYGTALAAVMLEGCAFLLLSALGLRARLARAIPRPLRLASAAGIGLFLAFAGLQAHQGLGLVGPSGSTLVALADGAMRSPRFWLGAAGLVATATCLSKGVRGSMIYGIVLVTAASWFRRTPVTFFPGTPEGDSGYAYFARVVDLHVGGSTSGKISLGGLFATPKAWVHLLTLLYVDVLDTTGSMYSMAEYGGFTDEKGRFEGEYRAFIVDASSTVISASLGTTTVTTFLESTAGIKEGGRTGITAVTAGACFAAAVAFTPVMTSVPPWAVGGPLVLVGVMMMRVAREVEWGEMREAVPAFVTMVVMPLTFSIANGIVAGVGVWVAMGAWDWVHGGVMWVWRAREMMKEARNQVAAAATATAAATTAAEAEEVDGVEHVV